MRTRVKRVMKRWGGVAMLLAVVLLATSTTAPAHAQTATPPPATSTPTPSGCVGGADAVTGDPCLDIQATTLMTGVFKWANTIIPILLPLVAIVIGIGFGSQIIGGIKNMLGGFKL